MKHGANNVTHILVAIALTCVGLVLLGYLLAYIGQGIMGVNTYSLVAFVLSAIGFTGLLLLHGIITNWMYFDWRKRSRYDHQNTKGYQWEVFMGWPYQYYRKVFTVQGPARNNSS